MSQADLSYWLWLVVVVIGIAIGIVAIVLGLSGDSPRTIDPDFCFDKGYGFIGSDSRGVFCETESGPGVYHNDDEITLFTYEEYDEWKAS